MLPSLDIKDINSSIEEVQYETKSIGKIRTWWFEQPTNGINYIRIKADLSGLPNHLRVFVPMFTELFSGIGTKNYKYDQFNDRLFSCTNGVSVRLDSFSTS